MTPEDRLALAKARPIQGVAERLGLTLRNPKGENAGPCPKCGGTDRFSVNTALGIWNCRVCAKGGDALALAQHVRGLTFPAAIDFVLGNDVSSLAPDQAARALKEAERKAKAQEDYAAAKRAQAIRDAREIWHSARGADVAPAAAYLAGRGVRFPHWPPALRFLPDHAYEKHFRDGSAIWFRGPCIISAVTDLENRVRAVHQTWIDPARPGEKARVMAPDGSTAQGNGKPWPAKLVRGAKKGCAIRLTRADPGGRMVMAEGIETTGSALAAGIWPGAALWAGVDLGNMSGRMLKRAGVKWSGEPDPQDCDAFLPPKWVRQLLLIQDGDSSPKMTRARLESCARRAMAARPGLRVDILAADPGADLNDMLRKQASDN